jgi:hypothetical protein
MIFFVILVCTMFTSLVVQHFIPPLPGPWFEGARVLLMPLVMFYGALAMPYGAMLALTFLAGFMWDALNTQILTLSVDMVSQPAVEISLGWSIILYAVLGSIMNGLRPLFRRGRWEVHCLLSGIFTSLIVLTEFLMITFRRGSPVFPDAIWERVLGAGVMASMLAPLIFFSLNSVAALTGFQTRPERSEP